MTCPQCGADRGDTIFCTSCGLRFPDDVTTEPADVQPAETGPAQEERAPATCAQCGAPRGDTAFCTSCGARLDDAASTVVAGAPVLPPPTSGLVVPEWAGPTPRDSAATKKSPTSKKVALVCAGVLVIGLLSAGTALGVKQLSKDDADRTEATTSATPAATTEPSADPTPDDEPTPEPTPTPPPTPQNTCWDGKVVDRGTECSTAYDETTLFYAFGVKASDCRADGGDPWNDLSYKCDIGGASLHLARYRTAADRDDRLGDYGSCDPFGGDRTECSPGVEAARYQLVYDQPDLLFYASSKDEAYSALSILRDRQRTASDLRFGVPKKG